MIKDHLRIKETAKKIFKAVNKVVEFKIDFYSNKNSKYI
jgi:hypothetical protein